jgi:hypothetical protein
MRTIELKKQRVSVAAPKALCFEVAAAGGKVREKRSDSEKVVEFTSDYKGREIRTLELVTLHPHDAIDYRWLKGPLSHVEERISFEEAGPNTTEIVYEGEFALGPGPLRWLLGRVWIKRRYDRVVLEHLGQGKKAAEQRARRTRTHPS